MSLPCVGTACPFSLFSQAWSPWTHGPLPLHAGGSRHCPLHPHGSQALAIFWSHAGETSLDPCITNSSTFISNLPTILLLKRQTFSRTSSLPHTALEHTGLSKFACNNIQVNICIGFFVLMSTVTLDVVLVFISYIPILCAIFYLPSQDACHKALNPVGPMSVSSYSFMGLLSSQPPRLQLIPMCCLPVLAFWLHQC